MYWQLNSPFFDALLKPYYDTNVTSLIGDFTDRSTISANSPINNNYR